MGVSTLAKDAALLEPEKSAEPVLPLSSSTAEKPLLERADGVGDGEPLALISKCGDGEPLALISKCGERQRTDQSVQHYCQNYSDCESSSGSSAPPSPSVWRVVEVAEAEPMEAASTAAVAVVPGQWVEGADATAVAPTDTGAVDFGGDWTLTESDNFDAYLQAIGVGWAKRKMVAMIFPTQSWERRPDGSWQFSVQTPLGPKVEAFPIGTPIEDVVDGVTLRKTSSWTHGGSVLVTHAESPIGVGEFRRYVRADDKLVLEMKAPNSVLCTRVFSRSSGGE